MAFITWKWDEMTPKVARHHKLVEEKLLPLSNDIEQGIFYDTFGVMTKHVESSLPK